MVRRSKRHFGLDDDFIRDIWARFVKRSADVTLAAQQHRLVIGLPNCIPILLLHLGNRILDLHFHPVIFKCIANDGLIVKFLLDISQQDVFIVSIHKTVAAGIAKNSREDVFPRFRLRESQFDFVICHFFLVGTGHPLSGIIILSIQIESLINPMLHNQRFNLILGIRDQTIAQRGRTRR